MAIVKNEAAMEEGLWCGAKNVLSADDAIFLG